MDVKSTIHSFIDKIFKPPISFLDLSIEKLNDVQLVTRQGINVGKYLSVLGDLPTAWQLVVSSLLISVVFLTVLLMVRAFMRMYYSIKDGVKWW